MVNFWETKYSSCSWYINVANEWPKWPLDATVESDLIGVLISILYFDLLQFSWQEWSVAPPIFNMKEQE